jgi:hypothetical protein
VFGPASIVARRPVTCAKLARAGFLHSLTHPCFRVLMHTPLDSITAKLNVLSLTHKEPPSRSPIVPIMATPTLQSDEARVYCEYDLGAPPPHPGSDWTRFICLSDTHGHTFTVPPGDVLIHAGDLSQYGSPVGLEATVTWLQSLPHPVKL